VPAPEPFSTLPFQRPCLLLEGKGEVRYCKGATGTANRSHEENGSCPAATASLLNPFLQSGTVPLPVSTASPGCCSASVSELGGRAEASPTGGALIVGIVGGIAAGKSTVVAMLVECGAEFIDADSEAHRVLEQQEVKAALVEWLGPQVVSTAGHVDRAQVAQKVFADPQALERLQGLVHPGVRRGIEQKVKEYRSRASSPMLVLDVPLLLESQSLTKLCDKLVFIDANQHIRSSRVAARNWSAEELQRRESFQIDIEEKRSRADLTIDTSGTLDVTREQVKACFNQLVGLGSGQNTTNSTAKND